MDGRLAMCGIAVGVAMFAMLWDFLYPFPQSRYIIFYIMILPDK
jgi:signal peptidase complex subunit 2